MGSLAPLRISDVYVYAIFIVLFVFRNLSSGQYPIGIIHQVCVYTFN